MKITTYKGPMTNYRTILCLFKGKCGHKNYVEYQIFLKNNVYICYKTDGYKLDLVGTYPGQKPLKSVINLIWEN